MPEWYEKEQPEFEPGEWVERASPGSPYPVGTKAMITGAGPYPQSFYVEPESADEGITVMWMGTAIRPAAAPEGHDDGEDDAEANPFAGDPLLAVLERIAGHLEAIAANTRGSTFTFNRTADTEAENNEVFKDEAYAAAAGLQNTGGMDRATLRAARLAHEADNDGSRDCGD